MLSIIVATLCAATAAPEPVKLAATGFTVVGLEKERAAFYTEHFAAKLTAEGLRVTTAAEMEAVLGLERQKQLLGCSDESSSCLAEIANALGVDGLVLGSIAKVGEAFQVDLKVLAAQNAQRISSYSARVGSEEQVLDALQAAAEKMAPEVARAFGKTLPVKERPPSAARKWFWVPAAVGVAFAVGGGYELSVASAAEQRLRTDSMGATEAQNLLSSGQTARTLGYAGLGVAAAGLLTSGALFLLSGPDAQVAPQVSVGPQGAFFGVAGVLP